MIVSLTPIWLWPAKVLHSPHRYSFGILHAPAERPRTVDHAGGASGATGVAGRRRAGEFHPHVKSIFATTGIFQQLLARSRGTVPESTTEVAILGLTELTPSPGNLG
jgi:hypothetical protein